MATAIIARLQTPVDVDGRRKDVHFITNERAISVTTPEGRNVTLKERFEEMGPGIVESASKPSRSCVWFKVKSVE